jgi:hypothetical protein
MKVTPAILLLLAAGACAPEVPANPTWIDDVRPILAANCIRCHSPPQIGAAPLSFRLDKYDDELLVDGPYDIDLEPDLVFGASSQGASIVAELEAERMPPRFPLTNRQIDVFSAWLSAAGGDFPARGEPRPDNATPSMSIVGAPVVSEGRVRIEYDIDDADDDIVTGAVTTADQVGEEMPLLLSNRLFAGRGSLSFELPSGTYDLVALLDDGNVADDVVVEIATVEVP